MKPIATACHSGVAATDRPSSWRRRSRQRTRRNGKVRVARTTAAEQRPGPGRADVTNDFVQVNAAKRPQQQRHRQDQSDETGHYPARRQTGSVGLRPGQARAGRGRATPGAAVGSRPGPSPGRARRRSRRAGRRRAGAPRDRDSRAPRSDTTDSAGPAISASREGSAGPSSRSSRAYVAKLASSPGSGSGARDSIGTTSGSSAGAGSGASDSIGTTSLSIGAAGPAAAVCSGGVQPVHPVGHVENPARDLHPVVRIHDGAEQLARVPERGHERCRVLRSDPGGQRLAHRTGEDRERCGDRILARYRGGAERADQVVEPKVALGRRPGCRR